MKMNGYVSAGYTEFKTERQVAQYCTDFSDEIQDLRAYAHAKFGVQDYLDYSIIAKDLTFEECKEKIAKSQALVKKYLAVNE
ncbi:MAG: hypothetical protein LBS47_00690 [Endomicrobium sp.]|jgi:hypothetical protein|nr:hypothetical protein [Endomicrobium sp.]